MHLLFVCTGNICRSPTAERLVRAYAAALPDPGQLTAASAGTRAVYDAGIHPLAVPVLRGLGGDEVGFAARQISPEIVAQADVVLTMTDAHRSTVLNASPRHLQRTFTLLEAADLAPLVTEDRLPDPADLTARGRALAKAMVGLRATRYAGDRSEVYDDITDPIGGDPILFANVGEEIAKALTAYLDVLTGRR